MTATEIEDALAAAASEVLETMFFAEVAGEVPAPADALAARLEFHGSPPGVFTIAVNKATARGLASAFLASDESDISERQACEVLCEMANMICGSMLSRLEPDAAFELHQPAIVPPGPAAGVSRILGCGQGAVALWIDLQPNA